MKRKKIELLKEALGADEAFTVKNLAEAYELYKKRLDRRIELNKFSDDSKMNA